VAKKMAKEIADEVEGREGGEEEWCSNLPGHAKVRVFTPNMTKLYRLIFGIMCRKC